MGLLCLTTQLFSQLKVGDNPTTINPNSVIEIESTNKGLLMPRLALVSSTVPTPLNMHIAGMTVYNTATSNDLTPGFYYNDGAKWVKLGKSFDVVNGIQVTPDNKLKLGGPLSEPTVIGTNGPNTLAIQGLNTGSPVTDEVVMIDPSSGVLKKAPTSSLVKEAQAVHISIDGQTNFPTPMQITDINKVNVYRNGARIGAFMINNNTISLEAGVICVSGDEIRIVQFN